MKLVVTLQTEYGMGREEILDMPLSGLMEMVKIIGKRVMEERLRRRWSR